MIQRTEAATERLTLAVLSLGTAVFALAQSMVAPILPLLQHHFHTTQATVTWLLTAYLLSAAVCTPILGRVGDIFGKQRLFVIILIVFAVGCGLAALAPNIAVMIIGRVIQGAGGALLPLGFGIIRDELPHHKVAPAIGLMASLLGVGSGLGVAVAGPTVDLLSYQWLFWLPLIVTVIAAAIGYLVLTMAGQRAAGGINWMSAVMLAGWLSCLLLACSEGSSWGWLSSAVIGLIVGAAVLLVAWIAVELRTPIPLIDVRMLGQREVSRVDAVSFMFGVMTYATFAFVPQLVQAPRSTRYGYGASVTDAGVILVSTAVTTIVFGVIAAPLVRRIGAKPVVVAGSALGVFAFLALVVPGHHETLVFVACALVGASYGLAVPTMSNIIVQAVPADQTGVANGMNTNFRIIGGATGSAVLAGIITADLLPGGYPTSAGYTSAWLVLVGVAVVSTVLAFAIPATRRPTDSRAVRVPVTAEPVLVDGIA